MFINFTNHPSASWSIEQLTAAQQFGELIDLPFPTVEPEASEEEIQQMAEEQCKKIKTLADTTKSNKESEQFVVHIMGEMTLTYAIVCRMKKEGIICVASTTRREVSTLPDGSKVSTFRFVKFRKY